MKDIDWSPWLIRMSKGDEEAFRTVYEATRDHAYGLIYYLAPRKQDVGDIMSEVYSMSSVARCPNHDGVRAADDG